MDKRLIAGGVVLLVGGGLGWWRLVKWVSVGIGATGVAAIGLIALNWRVGRWMQRERLLAQKQLGERTKPGRRKAPLVSKKAMKKALEEQEREGKAEWKEGEMHSKIKGEVAVGLDRIIDNMIRDFILKVT